MNATIVFRLSLVVAPLLLRTVEAQTSERHLRVAVQITEETGGLFTSALTSSLRALGDVDVVPAITEPWDFALSGTVICFPSCGSATHYAVSLLLYRPITGVDLWTAMMKGLVTGKLPMADTIALYPLQSSFRKLDWDFSRTYLRWSQELYGSSQMMPRATYHRQVQELIAQIDVQCFRMARLGFAVLTAGARHDTSSILRLAREQARLLRTESNVINDCDYFMP